MNKRYEGDIRPAINARLSAVKPDRQTAQRVLERAHRTAHRRQQLSLAPVLAMALVLSLAAVACAAASYFGVLDFRQEQAENETYVAAISGIGTHLENDFLTIDVNEAVFDGTRLDLTMDIRHKEGADVVYVLPSIQAQSGGKPLSVAMDSGNLSWEEGFFLPEQQPLHAATEQAGVGFVLSDAMPQGETVEWTLRFDVLRPLYPIDINQKSLDQQEGEMPFNVYIQDYIDAYHGKRILLDASGGLIMYDGAVSMGAAFGDSAWEREGFAERLISCGAFERVDTLEAPFCTQAAQVFSPSLPETFTVDEWHEATLTRLDVTFARADYEIEIRRTDGQSAAQAYLDQEGYYEFALLAEGVSTAFLGGWTYPDVGADAVCISGSVQLSALPDALTIVPCRHDQKTPASLQPQSVYAVYDAQQPLTQEQAQRAFTVRIR